jgi:alpha-amylase
MKVPASYLFTVLDWTALDPNFGTKADLANLEKAHAHGIRIVLDGVINHTGPITETDVAYYWVRTSPVCDYKNYQNTTECTSG